MNTASKIFWATVLVLGIICIGVAVHNAMYPPANC